VTEAQSGRTDVNTRTPIQSAEATQDTSGGLAIADIEATPISYRIEGGARLGIGRAVKRDAVVVKVTTKDGHVGWGESHHARAANVTAAIVNSTLRDICLGQSAADVVGVWDSIYRMQLKSHGLGAATAMAMSGIDMALWDIRGKAVGWPLYLLLGGRRRPVEAYAGGVALGWQDPEALVEEVRPLLESGYRSAKLRVGDTPERDISRVQAVREAFGEDLLLMVDANTEYSLADVARVMPVFEELRVRWLEEPFPPHDYRSYRMARALGRVALAAGENHFTRYEFSRMVEDAEIGILQPDLSKAGGVTEVLRIAALGSAWKLPICPHTSMTGLNMAATVHLLAAIDNAGYFEGDASRGNLFRDDLVDNAYTLEKDGTILPNEAPGLGVCVDEGFIATHPFIEGPNYVRSDGPQG
jgi:L-alanine-DL-glutamate epimerase-like enolase superfamily enzyme